MSAFLPGDCDLVLSERASAFLQRQTVLAHLDEVVQQPGLLTAYAGTSRPISKPYHRPARSSS